jgi:hypothetical protein
MIHPQREWVLGLVFGLLTLVGGAGWSFLTYGEVSERDVQNVDTVEVQQTVYRGEMVEAALEQFRQKNSEYQALLVASTINNLDIEEDEMIADSTESSGEEVTEEEDPETGETSEVAPEAEEIEDQPVEIEMPRSIGEPETPPDLQPGF